MEDIRSDSEHQPELYVYGLLLYRRQWNIFGAKYLFSVYLLLYGAMFLPSSSNQIDIDIKMKALTYAPKCRAVLWYTGSPRQKLF